MPRLKQTPNRGIPTKRLRKPAKPERSSGIKRKRRLRPGTGALRDIRRQQKNSHETQAFTKAEFRRLVKDIAFDLTGDPKLRFRRSALRALQEATEDFFSQGFGFAQDMAVLAGVVTPTAAMVRYALQNIMLTQGHRTAPNAGWMSTLGPAGAPAPTVSERQRAEEKEAQARRAADKEKRRAARRAEKQARREARRLAEASETEITADGVAVGSESE